jgi:quercetin dioxygenase-like cupin family protein
MAANAPVPRCRAEAPSTDAIARFDLQDEITQANGRRPWPSGVFSKTLVKRPDIRLVLVMLEAGARMKDHHADGSVSLHVLRGRMRLRCQDADDELGPSHVVSLAPGLRHDVEALEPCVLLLTLSWPESEKLRQMPHRGYGS